MRNSNIAKSRRCFGYVRASTSSQEDSLEMQRERIEGIARAEGLELVAVFTDAATSGGVPMAQREQGKALLECAQARRRDNRLKAGSSFPRRRRRC